MSDLIQPSSIDADRYLELLIEKQVNIRVEEYIKGKRTFILQAGKFLLPVVALLTFLAIGSFTLWQLTSFGDLKEKTKEAKQSAESLAGLTTQAQANIKDSNDLRDKAQILFDKSFELMSNNVTHVLSSQDKLIQSQEQVMSTQSRLRNDIESEVTKVAGQRREIDEIYRRSNEKFTDLNLRMDETKTRAERVNRESDEVSKKYLDVFVKADQMQSLIELNEQMIRLTAADTIWMHQRMESEAINLLNIDDPGSPGFLLKLKIDDITDRETPLDYKVKLAYNKEWSGWQELGKIQNIPATGVYKRQAAMPIPNTPYEVKVEFINDTKGRDFVALRIQPRIPVSGAQSAKRE